MAKQQPAVRRALGRGLTSLIPQLPDKEQTDDEVFYVDINAIKPNPFQPRTDWDDETIKELAESIKSQGLLQPITLRKKSNNSFEIISGERRFRATKLLGTTKIPAIIKAKVSDRQMLSLALVENIQRKELNEIEAAGAYQRLLGECGISHEELSRQVGKSRSVISNTLRLLKLPEKVQGMLRSGALSMGHARALLSIDNEEKQCALADRIVAEQLSVRQVEQAAGAQTAKKTIWEKKTPVAGPVDPNLAELLQRMQYKFGTAVTIKEQAKDKGKLEIHYYSSDDLHRIVSLIGA